MTAHMKILLALVLATALASCSSIATKNRAAQCPDRYSPTIERNASAESARLTLEAKYPGSIWSQSREPSYIVASYVVDVRERIKYFAKNNYPNEIRGKYGDGFAVATINSDGRVVEVNLLRTTGLDVLDSTFLDMICYPAGYPAFSDELHGKTSVLHVTFPFGFINSTFEYGANP